MFKDMFERLFKKEEASSSVAKNRLKVVIMQDRTSFPPIVLQNLKDDLMGVFSKYFEMEEDELQSFKIENENNSLGLSISIPIKKVKTSLCEENEE